MKLLKKSVLRRPFFAVVLTGGLVVGFGVWRTRALSNATSVSTHVKSTLERESTLQERIRKGVGSEVHFSTTNDSNDEITTSVESVARFIHARCGLEMSDDTRKALEIAEKETLTGQRSRIKIDDLTNSFTDIATTRLGALTDSEVESAAKRFRATSDGQISTRMSGKWGWLTREEFAGQLKEARGRKQRGDSTVDGAVRPFVEEEINDRIANLSTAMPDKFRDVKNNGITPIEAVLIAYSVAADDNLADSHDDLAERIVQDRSRLRLTRTEARQEGRDGRNAFGLNGFFHSSPVSLVFNKTTLKELLSPKGGKK